MRYSDTLYEHFRHPCHVGLLAEDIPGRGVAKVGEPQHGAVIELYIQVDQSSQRLVDARFKAYGCGATIASASWLCAWLPGHTIEQVRQLHDATLSAALALPPAKLHCAVLAVAAAHAAVADYLSNS